MNNLKKEWMLQDFKNAHVLPSLYSLTWRDMILSALLLYTTASLSSSSPAAAASSAQNSIQTW